MTIYLAGDYTIDGTRITLRTEFGEYRYILPKGARRVVLQLGKQPKLMIGGFKSLTVSVVGPLEDLRTLADACA